MTATVQLARILGQHDAVPGLCDLGKECVDQRGLAGRGAPAISTFLRSRTAMRNSSASVADMMPEPT